MRLQDLRMNTESREPFWAARLPTPAGFALEHYMTAHRGFEAGELFMPHATTAADRAPRGWPATS